ncbi:DNA polymerase Y family protein [Humidisolicoccus flavus]|uniref:DNA polymerase Y family protein n=1 Tax=Humidisolicoccus flavus TaxID=3111414 RepID=UPI003248CC29
MSERVLLLWYPDWPVYAATIHRALPDGVALALLHSGKVFAVSASARSAGVRRGHTSREAQSRCPEITVLQYDPDLDQSAFEAVITRVEAVIPGVQVLRPGVIVLRARGPARFYGDERSAAIALAKVISESELPGAAGVKVGIADTVFAAEAIVRYAPSETAATNNVVIAPPGSAAQLLAPLPITIFEDASFTAVLQRLGIETLGQFASLAEDSIVQRFGESGARAHLLASGREPGPLETRVPPPDLGGSAEFEAPLDRVDQIAFAFRQESEAIVARLRAASLVATSINVVLRLETGILHERTWLHPKWFTASDILDRVRWQVQGGTGETALAAAISSITVTPETVDGAAKHEPGLWGSESDGRIEHGISRVQSMVGHEGVLTAVLAGGRLPGETQALVPWGDRVPDRVTESANRPWPGTIPGVAPALLLRSPSATALLDERGTQLTITEQGVFSALPAQFVPPREFVNELELGEGERGTHFRTARVVAWAGPWPLQERWWDRTARSAYRVQIIATEQAWLLVFAKDRWWVEALYDG